MHGEEGMETGKMDSLSSRVESVYLIGIGGIAMGSLAAMLKDLGCRVAGSDQESLREDPPGEAAGHGLQVGGHGG